MCNIFACVLGSQRVPTTHLENRMQDVVRVAVRFLDNSSRTSGKRFHFGAGSGRLHGQNLCSDQKECKDGVSKTCTRRGLRDNVLALEAWFSANGGQTAGLWSLQGAGNTLGLAKCLSSLYRKIFNMVKVPRRVCCVCACKRVLSVRVWMPNIVRIP